MNDELEAGMFKLGGGDLYDADDDIFISTKLNGGNLGGKYRNPIDQAKHIEEKNEKNKEWLLTKGPEEIAKLVKQRDNINNIIQRLGQNLEDAGINYNDNYEYAQNIISAYGPYIKAGEKLKLGQIAKAAVGKDAANVYTKLLLHGPSPKQIEYVQTVPHIEFIEEAGEPDKIVYVEPNEDKNIDDKKTTITVQDIIDEKFVNTPIVQVVEGVKTVMKPSFLQAKKTRAYTKKPVFTTNISPNAFFRQNVFKPKVPKVPEVLKKFVRPKTNDDDDIFDIPSSVSKKQFGEDDEEFEKRTQEELKEYAKLETLIPELNRIRIEIFGENVYNTIKNTHDIRSFFNDLHHETLRLKKLYKTYSDIDAKLSTKMFDAIQKRNEITSFLENTTIQKLRNNYTNQIDELDRTTSDITKEMRKNGKQMDYVSDQMNVIKKTMAPYKGVIPRILKGMGYVRSVQELKRNK